MVVCYLGFDSPHLKTLVYVGKRSELTGALYDVWCIRSQIENVDISVTGQQCPKYLFFLILSCDKPIYHQVYDTLIAGVSLILQIKILAEKFKHFSQAAAARISVSYLTLTL